MAHRHTAIVAAILWMFAPVIACEIRVRDSAFRTARDLHKLCVIADSSDKAGDEIQARLEHWLESVGQELNLEVVLYQADDPDIDWRALGLPSAPPRLPVTVLVGRDNGLATNFLIDYWEPEPTPEQLESIAASPIRSELARLLATHVAVLLYAPATGTSSSAKATEIRSMIEKGIDGERIGLSMLVLDRDDSRERLLSKFMGLRPDGPDTICVAFGRGKLMSPPLVGEEITTANIDQLVTQIRQACSCSKPLPTMGVDVPLVWSEAVDSTVILMDDELDMSTLADEVETMLAAKVSEVAGANEAALIPIPTGNLPELPRMEANPIQTDAARPDNNSTPAPAIVGIASIRIIVVVLALISAGCVVFFVRRMMESNSPP